MTAWRSIAILLLLVVAILTAHRQPIFRPLFKWLPAPLWCYALPMTAVALGLLPQPEPSYKAFANQLLPLALGLLSLGVDLPAVIHSGRAALLAMAVGGISILIGAPVAVWLLQGHLPPEAWKGAGTLAATWTGGTMNLLALRSILETPERVFAPLIVVDAMVAYGWMALLVAASGLSDPINRWLRVRTAPECLVRSEPIGTPPHHRSAHLYYSLVACTVVALALTLGARLLAAHLPTSGLVNSSTGWTVLLVTTAALGLSLVPSIRRLGSTGEVLGYPGLYLVLAATGAQASLQALWAAPVWIVVGISTVLFHGVALCLAGRCFKIPLGVLATASQANVGGVVSAPLVGAVYHPSLAPVGLLLAMAGNAVGTYLGLFSASICRALIGRG